MMTDGQTNCVYFSDLLPGQHPELFQRLEEILEQAGIWVGLIPDTRDIWCRDYMPIQVGPGRFVQFRYAPSYLRGAEHAASITPPEVARDLPEIVDCEVSNIALDGGNVIRWYDTAIMTDKVYSENRGCDRAGLQAEIGRLLAVDRLIVIPKEPYELFGHADGVLRFVDSQSVLVNNYAEIDPDYGTRLRTRLDAAGLRCIELPYVPSAAKTRGVPSAAGTYVNFLQVGDLIICPSYGMDEDRVAVKIIRSAVPDSNVVSVDCRGLAAEGGVLNCVSWNILA